ncbi:hypothetical protein MSAN_01807400 [Mycena sanguinolenta]|uniref:Uncharacterized protein n=1 Tax=Mycena sanguinolenta TaxID=230812 RepID=A0A8H6XUA3_9AGAR|nr:hypothetical protein MSAN_01807400 [Mycena sanguinolenta]
MVNGPNDFLRVMPDAGSFAIWSIAPSGNPGSNEYTFTHTATNTAIIASRGILVSTNGPGDSFTISPAGEGTFTIQVPNQDKVWTVFTGSSDSTVFLQAETGEIQSRWKFVRVD